MTLSICQNPQNFAKWSLMNAIKKYLGGWVNPRKNSEYDKQCNCITNIWNNFTEGNGEKRHRPK